MNTHLPAIAALVVLGTASLGTGPALATDTPAAPPAGTSSATGQREVPAPRPGPHRPVLKALDPSSGPIAGGTRFVLRGRHFTEKTSVVFGKHGRVEHEVKSGRKIVGFTPSVNRPHQVAVRLRTGTLTSRERSTFTYVSVAPPVVTVPVDPTGTTTLQAGDAFEVTAPSGVSDGQPAVLSYAASPTTVESLGRGFDFLTYGDLHLSTGQPAQPLTLRWQFASPLPTGAEASFYTGNPETEAMRPVPTVISADRLTATANVTSLSFKGFATWLEEEVSTKVGQLLSTRGDRPTCQGRPPQWVTDTIYIDQTATGDNPLLACVGHDPADRRVLVVKVTNNRGHGLVVDVPVGWRWIHLTGLDGLSDNIVQLARLLSPGLESTKILLAPGQQAHFGFGREAVDGLTSFTVQGEVDALAVAYGVLVQAIGDALGDQVGVPVLAAAAIATCFVDESGRAGGSAAEVVRQMYDRLTCLTNVNAWATLVSETLPNHDFYDKKYFRNLTKIKAVTAKVNAYLSVFSAAQQLFELAASLSLPSEAFSVTAFVTPRPVGHDTEAMKDELFTLVNDYRVDRGCWSLYRHPTLDRTAQEHSDDMAWNGYFSIVDFEGRDPGDRMDEAGYWAWGWGEVITRGRTEPADVFAGWLDDDDPDLKAIVEDCAYDDAGVGLAFTADDVPYWTFDLAY